MTAQAYPLTWPDGFPRSAKRDGGKFRTSLAGALKNVQDSLRMFSSDSGKKIDGMVISSNVTLGQQRPADPGVAVWFTWDGLQVCIPVDRYSAVEGNLQAIHHIIEARRAELRHGGLHIVRAAFAGFKSLPAPSGPGWRETLGNPHNIAAAEIAYRERAKAAHPDRPGGSHEAMAHLNRAIEAARKEWGGGAA